MINFNLAGDALVHCLKVSGAQIVLVDEDDNVQERLSNERLRIVQELGLTPITLNKGLKRDITTKRSSRPDDSYRAGVRGNFPGALFYTRYECFATSVLTLGRTL